jgi:DNA-binding transcriptional LysR family regulator
MPIKPVSERISNAALTDSIPGLDLNLLMLFLEIVNAGSISQAALRLHTPKATLSRKLRLLEEQIGAVLVKRGSQRLELTEIGAAFLQRCERIAIETQDASLIASEMQSKVRGLMRISMPFGLARTWFSRALAAFALQYPELRLTIHVTNRWVDVSEEPYDVAICIGRVRNEQLPARRLAELPRGLYASPAYCERKGVPLAVADLASHDCVALESQLNEGLWAFASGANGTVTPHLTTTDIQLARELAVAGVGIAMLTHGVSEAHVKAGRLVRLLPECRIPPVLMVAMFLERRHMLLRTRTFIDLMAEAIRLDGHGPAAASANA